MQDDRAGQAQKATTTDDKMRHMIDDGAALTTAMQETTVQLCIEAERRRFAQLDATDAGWHHARLIDARTHDVEPQRR